MTLTEDENYLGDLAIMLQVQNSDYSGNNRPHSQFLSDPTSRSEQKTNRQIEEMQHIFPYFCFLLEQYKLMITSRSQYEIFLQTKIDWFDPCCHLKF